MSDVSAKRIIVAYSGGLDTSVIITWLKEKTGAEVVAFTADVGQGEELAPLNDKAIKTGAEKLIIEDLRDLGFSDEDIWDIAEVAAMFNFTNRMASATGMIPNPEYHAMAR